MTSYTLLHTLPLYEQVEGMVLLSALIRTSRGNGALVVAAATPGDGGGNGRKQGQIRLWKNGTILNTKGSISDSRQNSRKKMLVEKN